MIPLAPARFSSGIIFFTTDSSNTTSKATQSGTVSRDIVGFFKAGSNTKYNHGSNTNEEKDTRR